MMYGKGPHGCPRGFHWCEKKEECVPEGTGVKDVLKKENERYFFKEGNEGNWAEVKQKCWKLANEKRRTKDVIRSIYRRCMDKHNWGKPKKEGKIMDTDKLVDDVFESGFDQFGKVRTAEKEIDILLEKIKDEIDFGKGSLSTTGRPYDHPIKARVVPSVDGKAEVAVDECVGPTMNEERFEGSEYDEDAPAKEDDSRKLANVINTVPNQNVGGLLKSIHRQLAEMRVNEDYKTYFKSMLKKYGYDSPANIPADKKKEFFNAVDKGWKGKKETD